MPYEPKEGQGSLWKNDRKEKDTHPDLKGSILIGGKEYWISAWAKTHDTRGKWLSLSAQPKESKPAQPAAPQPAAQDGDNLPF